MVATQQNWDIMLLRILIIKKLSGGGLKHKQRNPYRKQNLYLHLALHNKVLVKCYEKGIGKAQVFACSVERELRHVTMFSSSAPLRNIINEMWNDS